MVRGRRRDAREKMVDGRYFIVLDLLVLVSGWVISVRVEDGSSVEGTLVFIHVLGQV